MSYLEPLFTSEQLAQRSISLTYSLRTRTTMGGTWTHFVVQNDQQSDREVIDAELDGGWFY